jgi:dihydropteroate synthase
MTLVMGVLNVTPDSFSDGGAYTDHSAAISHALDLVRAGADIVDVGGESTRPGAWPVSGLGDPNMYDVIAALRTLYVLGHWRGTPQTMGELATYKDFLSELRSELGQRVSRSGFR